jgi:hypothetical protein
VGRDVVLLEAEMRWRHRERVDGFARRKSLEFRNHNLDHEASTGFQMRGHIPETRNLLVLRIQIHDGVAHEVGKGEGPVDEQLGPLLLVGACDPLVEVVLGHEPHYGSSCRCPPRNTRRPPL